MKKDYYAIHCTSYSRNCEEASFYGIAYSFEEALKLVREDIEAVKKNAIRMIPNIKAYLEEPAIPSDDASDYQIVCQFAYDEPDDFDDCEMIYAWMITKRSPEERHWDSIYLR